MRILIVGKGGREHALAWKCAQSSQVKQVFVAPGNAGTYREPNVENVDIQENDLEGLLNFAKKEHIDLTIIGPEGPLSQGVCDLFAANSLLCFGPNKDAAQLESSKSFAKSFMERHNIPTARHQTFSDFASAEDYCKKQPLPMVIKADGLCSGKGVVIASTYPEALATLDLMLNQKQFKEAGLSVVIEEYLIGEEVSYIVITDGKRCFSLDSSQDHKQRDANDQGPNTGGMGAYSPAPVLTPELESQILESFVKPTLEGLQKDGLSYQGFLYFGLMITKNGPLLLEYNCRLGDPEAQVLLFRLKNSIVDLCHATLTGSLGSHTPSFIPDPALGVVMAAEGYPFEVRTGDKIIGLKELAPSPSYKVFHSGTSTESGQIYTNGGRVVCVTASGPTLRDAQNRAYEITNKIKWLGAFYREDIGWKALKDA